MAKINLENIEGYAEMTAEEKLAVLEAYEYDDNAEALATAKSEMERFKRANDKISSEIAEMKRKHRETLSEEERLKAEQEEKVLEMQKELELLKAEKQKSEYIAQYVALGYDEELATSTADALMAGDMKAVFANQKAFHEALVKNTHAEVLKNTPKPNELGKGGNNTVTKEEFSSMGYNERAKLAEENPELYKILAD